MAKSKAPTDKTVQEQINVLRSLSQGAAASLLDIATGTLRQHVNAPRNSDESYNATELVAWRLCNVVRPDLSDDATEQFLRAMDAAFASDESGIPAALRTLRDLIEQHGDGARAMIADFVLDYLADYAESIAFQESPVAEHIQEQHRRKQERRREAEAALNVVSRCNCGKVRQGHKWIMPRIAPVFTIESVCPNCRK